MPTRQSLLLPFVRLLAVSCGSFKALASRTPKFAVPISSLLALFFAFGFVSPAALANAPAPPPQVWLEFVYETSQPLTLQGLQLANCKDSTCEQSQLLLQYGACTDAKCLSGSPLARDRGARLECAENTCLVVLPFDFSTSDLACRIVAQFSDQVRFSNILRRTSPNSQWFSGEYWQVTVTDTALSLKPSHRPSRAGEVERLWQGFVLTVAVELLVTALFLLCIKAGRALWSRTLITVAVLHLVTYPVVVGFFPSIQPFRYSSERVLGACCLGIAIAYGLLFWRFPRISSAKLVLSFVIGVPILWVVSFILAIIFGYGETSPAIIDGLPASVTLPASEVFAVVYEAGIICLLSRRKLPLQKASLLSLLANGASLLLGLWLLSPH